MKCRLNPIIIEQSKDWLYRIPKVVKAIGIAIGMFMLLVAFIMLLCFGIGYSIHNYLNIVTDIFASTPAEYYILTGSMKLAFFLVAVFLVIIGIAVAIPILKVIKNLPTVLKNIVICDD